MLQDCDFVLIDICFFMSRDGEIICGEVSTDNSTIAYRGQEEGLQMLFAQKKKSMALEKAKALYEVLRRA